MSALSADPRASDPARARTRAKAQVKAWAQDWITWNWYTEMSSEGTVGEGEESGGVVAEELRWDIERQD